MPPVGSELSPWSSPPNVDLDPALDDPQDFECSWRTVLATRQSKSIVLDPQVSSQDSDKTASVELEQAWIRKLRKGKFRAIDIIETVSKVSRPPSVVLDPLPVSIDAQRTPASKALPTHAVNSTRLVGADQGWAEQAKRRKKWWRAEIRGDPSYGRIWTFLPLVSHSPSHLPIPGTSVHATELICDASTSHTRTRLAMYLDRRNERKRPRLLRYRISSSFEPISLRRIHSIRIYHRISGPLLMRECTGSYRYMGQCSYRRYTILWNRHPRYSLACQRRLVRV